MYISIHGHAYNRKFIYKENGLYNEITVPGGASLLAKILNNKNLAENIPLDNAYQCEHLEIQYFSDKKSKKSYYAVTRNIGITEGKTLISQSPADFTLVWDEYGVSFDLPENNPVLWTSNKKLPNQCSFEKIANHCFLMLDADVLRLNGAMISRQISWERTATDLIWHLKNNPALSYLNKAPYILITFAEDGAVYIKNENGKLTANLVLTHGGSEGTLREKINGQIKDSFAVMAVSAALQFDNIWNNNDFSIYPLLKSAENLMLFGYSTNLLTTCNFDIKDPSYTVEPDNTYAIPSSPDQNAADPNLWCISNSVSNKRIFDIAFDYVMKGSSVIDRLPKLSFGALTTIDRWEIESYQNIRNLIITYTNSENLRPLSIAVFGSPGSGKSFGVTQIAKNVLPGKIEKLEFNVSQFTSSADLSASFQKVRDIVLEGKLPLVFFDEFDSERNNLPLGWVKNFLMPMQDGKFKDVSGEHPLGKCILVFAGGTAANFNEFIKPIQDENPSVQQAFKNIKGPDFVSRLRGTINVLGPNRADKNDKNYILRRALLLRSLCERKLNMAKDNAPISKNILWAMLLVPEYKHGARSMEAILDMSQINNNIWEPFSLPFYSQLSLHVDADAFIKLVLRETILNSYIEKLAIAIHNDFCEKENKRGNKNAPFNIPWDDLPEDIKDSNRDQAKNLSQFINMIGYDYDSGDTPFSSVDKFTEDEIFLIAQQSHIVWINSKLKAGWQYGTPRDDNKKIHPLLVDWEDLRLPKEEKQKDIDIAKNIIPLFKSVGLRIYKTF